MNLQCSTRNMFTVPICLVPLRLFNCVRMTGDSTESTGTYESANGCNLSVQPLLVSAGMIHDHDRRAAYRMGRKLPRKKPCPSNQPRLHLACPDGARQRPNGDKHHHPYRDTNRIKIPVTHLRYVPCKVPLASQKQKK